MHCLSETPTETSLEKLANEAAKDIIAAEKLQFLESQRGDAGRVVTERKVIPERYRRDVARIPT
jgi:hypothetical protein